jgi:hypothetical protein
MTEKEAAYLALGFLEHPAKKLSSHIYRYSGSLIFSALYGGERFPHDGEDPSR